MLPGLRSQVQRNHTGLQILKMQNPVRALVTGISSLQPQLLRMTGLWVQDGRKNILGFGMFLSRSRKALSLQFMQMDA